AYDVQYTKFYDRPVPGSDVEILSYSVQVSAVPAPSEERARPIDGSLPAGRVRSMGTLSVRDTSTAEVSPWPVFDRGALEHGARIEGPAIIAEDDTSTLVGPGWTATVNTLGYIEMVREET